MSALLIMHVPMQQQPRGKWNGTSTGSASVFYRTIPHGKAQIFPQESELHDEIIYRQPIDSVINHLESGTMLRLPLLSLLVSCQFTYSPND